MSLYGNGVYPNDMAPTNDIKAHMSDIPMNAMAENYLKMLIATKSELVHLLFIIMGISFDDLKWVDSIEDMDKRALNALAHGFYISRKTFNIYVKATDNSFVRLYNIHHLNHNVSKRANMEAVYYLKFDENPVGYFTLEHDVLKYDAWKVAPARNYPKVRVHTWKIPLFTTAPIGQHVKVSGLDVQIDFMINPVRQVQNQGRTHTAFAEGRGALGSYLQKTTPFYDTNVQNNFEMTICNNKRANRHMRYKVYGKGHFKHTQKVNIFPNTDYTDTVCTDMYVDKVYDTEADIPMSLGLCTVYDPNIKLPQQHQGYIITNNERDRNQRYSAFSREGIHPDPEDLTNPMDIAVHFEFRRDFNIIRSEMMGWSVFPTTGKMLGDFDHGDYYFLGYLVLQAYSGMVGSTLNNGTSRNFANQNAPRTIYSDWSQFHDTMFKVTLRVPNNIPIVSSNGDILNFASVKSWSQEGDLPDNEDMYYDDKYGYLILENTGYYSSNEEFIKFATKKEGGIYPNKESLGYSKNYHTAAYKQSKEHIWGTLDFYNDRICDYGGFLRPSIRDTYPYFEYTLWQNMNYPKFYVHPLTSALDKYWWRKTDELKRLIPENSNVGGVRMRTIPEADIDKEPTIYDENDVESYI